MGMTYTLAKTVVSGIASMSAVKVSNGIISDSLMKITNH